MPAKKQKNKLNSIPSTPYRLIEPLKTLAVALETPGLSLAKQIDTLNQAVTLVGDYPFRYAVHKYLFYMYAKYISNNISIYDRERPGTLQAEINLSYAVKTNMHDIEDDNLIQIYYNFVACIYNYFMDNYSKPESEVEFPALIQHAFELFKLLTEYSNGAILSRDRSGTVRDYREKSYKHLIHMHLMYHEKLGSLKKNNQIDLHALTQLIHYARNEENGIKPHQYSCLQMTQSMFYTEVHSLTILFYCFDALKAKNIFNLTANRLDEIVEQERGRLMFYNYFIPIFCITAQSELKAGKLIETEKYRISFLGAMNYLADKGIVESPFWPGVFQLIDTCEFPCDEVVITFIRTYFYPEMSSKNFVHVLNILARMENLNYKLLSDYFIDFLTTSGKNLDINQWRNIWLAFFRTLRQTTDGCVSSVMLFMFEYIMRLRQKSVENQLPTATLIVPFFELLDKTSDLSLDALAAYFNRSVTDTAFQGTREQKQRIATICYEVILRTIDTQGGASHTEVMNLIRELEAMECMDPVYYNQILTALKGIVLDTKLVLGKESEALLQLNELIQHIQLNFAQHPVFFDEVVMPFLEYINHYVAESEEEWPSGKLTHVQDIQERIVTLSELFALATTYQLDVDSDYRAVKKAIPKGLPAIDDIILHMEYWLHQHILPVPIQALLLDTIDDIWRAIRTSHPESLAAIIDVLEDKIALEPDGIEYYKAKIRCYEKQHQTQQITALQAELVRRFPALVEDPFLLKSWSRACLAMGQYSIAIDALKNIVTKQRYPQSNGFIEARLNLAYAYYATGEQAGLQDAEAIYQSELAKLHNRRKIGPREQRLFGEIYLGLARCKCRNKLFSEAMTYLLSILEPDHRVLFFQALVYQFQNQFLDAIAIGESLIAEGFWDAAPMLIQTYLRLQQSKEIDAKVDGLIRLIQSDAARLNSKAAYSEVRILLALKRYDDALTRLNHIVGESGHNQFTYRFMSRCYCKLNRREEAMALLDDIPEGNEKRFITEELQRTGGQHRFFQPAANHHDLLQELALDSNTDLIGIGNGMGFTDPYSHFVYRREIEFNNTSDFVGYGFY